MYTIRVYNIDEILGENTIESRKEFADKFSARLNENLSEVGMRVGGLFPYPLTHDTFHFVQIEMMEKRERTIAGGRKSVDKKFGVEDWLIFNGKVNELLDEFKVIGRVRANRHSIREGKEHLHDKG